MYVACLNLHFPGGALRERASEALARIGALPSPCLVLLQEACATTARAIAAGTQETHEAFVSDGVAPLLLTLVPLGARIRVRAVAFPPGLTRMRRAAHLVDVVDFPRASPASGARGAPLVVAHVHLESCASSARLRDAQAAWLRSEHGATVLAGDLNGLGGWRTHALALGGAALPKVRCERLRGSPHPMCVYSVSARAGNTPRAS